MVSYGATPGILTEDTRRTWGERVNEWRTTRGLSIEQLATLLQVNRSLVQGWERDDKKPADEADYVRRFRVLQSEAGETPGQDPKDWVASIWRARLREAR